METAFYRDTWAEIDLDAVRHNVRRTKGHLEDNVKLFAVVKANAYGHGDAEVARAALEAGADFLAVAFLDEAITLRKKGIDAPILILGAVRFSDAGLAADYGLAVTVYDHEWLASAAPYLDGKRALAVHLKCDTGMGRLGFRKVEELAKAEDYIRKTDRFHIEGVFTHFATADELDHSYYVEQMGRFMQFIGSLSEKPPLIHCSNSAAALRFHDSAFNAVRLGISMYGLSPSPDIKPILPFELEEAMALYTKIVHIKQVPKNQCISYGATYRTEETEWIATLPIGYADGWIRKLQGQEVLIDGMRVPIVGRVCMDQCMVKLPKYYPVGTKVTLIGADQGEAVTVDEIAEKLGTINYEVTCMISRRVPRIYIESGKTVSVRNELIDS